MLVNYFKLAWRNLAKNLQISFLNLAGLATGLACVILIYLWTSSELHVNKFNANDDYTYQVMQIVPDGSGAIPNTPGLLAGALAKEMPEVQYAASVIPSTWFDNKGLFSAGNAHVRGDAQFVSKDYFKIFSCHFTEGDGNTLFTSKNNIAISTQLAQRLFGATNNIIGKTIEWNQQDFNENYIVTGVFEKVAPNSTIQFDAVFNYDNFVDKRPQLYKWTNNDPSTYLLLNKGANVSEFNKKLTGFIKTKNAQSSELLYAQKFKDTYLYNHYSNGVPDGGRIAYIKLFSIVAIFILLIACINFMNLSTAKAIRRLKEVGIQKAMGASRRSLVVQYLFESILMTFLALIVAIVVVALLLPVFKQITGKDLSLTFHSSLIAPVAIIAVVTGVISGVYPALYLSRFKPALTLKGSLKNSFNETAIRKALVVFQFVVSVILIVAVIIVYEQMQLIETTNLGYNRDHIIYFDKGGKLSENKDDYKQGTVYKDLQALIDNIKAVPGVVNASNFRHSMVNREGGTTDITWQDKNPNDQTSFTDIACGYGFIETVGISMQEGRAYSTTFGSDNDKVVFNETAVKAMGLTNPIGKTVKIWGNDKQIIGVTKDFHFQSLYKNIGPCFFDLSMNARVSKIIVRLEARNEKATIDRIAKLYKAYTGEPLDYKFLDADYQALYISEERVAALSKCFAAIAIIISCLGLFGLTAFTAQRRKKEIGIRKVTGASASNITIMLSKDFLILAIISLLIAFPLSWWLMNNWLQSFAYRVSFSPFVFLLAGVSVLLITLITVSFQSVKAAVANPVNSLRSE